MNCAFKIVGTRAFASRDGNKNYVNVFCTFQDSAIVGTGVDNFIVSNDVFVNSKAKIGDMVIPLRNEKGFITGLYVVR